MNEIITLSAAVAACLALLATLGKAHSWLLRQRKQDEDILAIKAEQQLLTYGVLACLKGLKEQGCNGPVTEAVERIERHLNERAHARE